MKQTNFKNAQTTYQFILGPIKIKDGLFMGDQLAAKDIEFIISNKVTHVINTVSKVVPNLWERFGIQYLSVNWNEKQQNIFDKKNNAVNAIFHFIQQAMEQGQSCLIHSVNGKSRACAVLVSYMMKKYQWSLDKCLQFVSSKKQHLEVRNNFLSQMQQLQKRMMQIYNLSSNWQDCKTDQQLILKNTYYNSKVIQCQNKSQQKNNKRKITWGQKTVITNKPQQSLMTTTMGRFKESKETKNLKVKSILKGQLNQQFDLDQQKQQKMVATDNFPKKDNNFISAINGNIVHVTVNNFITTDKKVIDNSANKSSHLTRPYSSDNKERILQKQIKKIDPKTKLFGYDNLQASLKSPYDAKLTTKIGSHNKLKKKQEIKNPVITYERPQSANIAAERRKMKNMPQNTLIQKKQQMMVMGKKRYPSTNPREELYKWK